jgi:hypothetical protein
VTCAVDLLPEHPPVNPAKDRDGATRWLVTYVPPRWLRLFRQPVSLVVETRPFYGHILFPTGAPAPRWAVRAIERSQSGVLTRDDLDPKQISAGDPRDGDR